MRTKLNARLADCVVIAGTMLVWLTVRLLVPSSSEWHPRWDFEFPYDGNVAVDMRFSPDGRSLAVVSADARTKHYRKQSAWIYEVPSGKLRHEIEAGAWQCAWNADGTILAVAAWNGLDFDLWESKTWTHKRHLVLALSATDREIVSLVPPAGLCFDRQGNFYAAEPYNGWDGFVPRLLRAKVWWNGSSSVGDAESIGSSDAAFDLSVSSLGPDTRVAISNEDRACTLEILRIQNSAGKQIVRQECKLNVSEAHGLLRAWVCLSADGQYLVARDNAQLCLFKLFDDHAMLVYSRSDKFATSVTGAAQRVLDVSLNGRFAAYGSEHRIRVVRISDGESVLEVPQEPDSLALSPDGRLLAVASRQRKSILFYRITLGKNGKFKGGRSE
jgi:WD40 repeat protein